MVTRSNCLVGAVGREGGEDSAASARSTTRSSSGTPAAETVPCHYDREGEGEACQLTVELEDRSESLLTASAKASPAPKAEKTTALLDMKEKWKEKY